MQKIVLISCVKKKLAHKAKAGEIYISPLFRYQLAYARSLNPDQIFILSAKYGLLSLETEVEPYEKTLNKMKDFEKKLWAEKVVSDLKKKTNITEDEFIILAGEQYRKYLVLQIKRYSLPLQGKGLGKQLQFLKNSVKR